MLLSTELYDRKHYQNGPENAFRHALWNYIIVKRCLNSRKNPTKVLRWTKRITDWHEDAFSNSTLARKMDEHNNAVGRQLFMTYGEDQEKVVHLLKKMTRESIQITMETDLNRLKQQFVHIKTT